MFSTYDRCSVFSRSPSESDRLCYVRMRTTVRMRTSDFVNFAACNCSPQWALLEHMRLPVPELRRGAPLGR
ncbi:hypothetical protein NDU88_003718 [Pleurodeles waltl]|uniref:Uncharacterized protein n=1 Tax=Pleurodeles waltl TaxID=8319 RepID=A0AAV7MRY5_PLEWA|nr:hypothetical protein NDU88_003718 [Pleurodeles waltl]